MAFSRLDLASSSLCLRVGIVNEDVPLRFFIALQKCLVSNDFSLVTYRFFSFLSIGVTLLHFSITCTFSESVYTWVQRLSVIYDKSGSSYKWHFCMICLVIQGGVFSFWEYPFCNTVLHNREKSGLPIVPRNVNIIA